MAATGPRTVAAVLVAGGTGSRLGADVPKAFCRVGGRTLIEHAAARFLSHPGIGPVVLVVPSGYADEARRLVPDARVVPGGTERRDSVSAGLAVLPPEVDTVLVSDVARPFVPAEVLDRVLARLAEGAVAVVPVVPVTDTVKQVLGDQVAATVDRTALRFVQTPQGFRRSVLEEAHRHSATVTDDAALVEALGRPVHVVAGAAESFKITHPEDLRLAELLLAGWSA